LPGLRRAGWVRAGYLPGVNRQVTGSILIVGACESCFCPAGMRECEICTVLLRHMGSVRFGPCGARRRGLAGLVACGRCGKKMTVRYQRGPGRTLHPVYVCSRDKSDYAASQCQQLAGPGLDAYVTGLLLAAMAPAALQVSLAAAGEAQAQRDQVDRIWRQRLGKEYDGSPPPRPGRGPPPNASRPFRCSSRVGAATEPGRATLRLHVAVGTPGLYAREPAVAR
jgi:hypothetical protein